MSDADAIPEHADPRDPVEYSFDQLRLNAAHLRHLAQQGRSLPEIDAGDPRTTAALRELLSSLFDAMTAQANATDQALDQYQPLYQARKRAHQDDHHVRGEEPGLA